MKSKMRRNFNGAFTARDLRNGAWVLTRPAPHAAAVYLSGADFGAPLAFAAAPLLDLGIEWRAGAALLTLAAAHRVHSVDAINVIVHEPLPQLYDALALPAYDAKSRRFWRRLFLLVKLPGAALLLRIVAASRRKPV